MATFRKLPSGSYRAEVARRGIRMSKAFPTKAAAKDWAARQEYLIVEGDEKGARGTLGDALHRYARERSPKKRGERWEIIRLSKLAKDPIALVRMADLKPAHLADWRDRREREVSPGSVIREMQLLSSVLTVSAKEWGLIPSNPASDVRRPKKPQPRNRLVQPVELDRLALVAGADLSTATARAFHAFLFAIETGMRAGEITGLTWDRVDLDRQVARLPMTKNGTARDVPLSSEAVRLLAVLPKGDPVFGLTADQRDILWRKVRDKAGIADLTFHDARHQAITNLSKKLDVLALARMVGHRDLRMLQVYYNETAEELAKRLG